MPSGVLIVDDDPVCRLATRTALEIAGYRVLEAADATEAAQTVLHRREEIQAVLLDYWLPGDWDNELALCRNLKSNAGTRGLVMVMFLPGPESWPSCQRTRRQAEQAGVSAFVAKPIDPQALVGTLQRALAVSPAP